MNDVLLRPEIEASIRVKENGARSNFMLDVCDVSIIGGNFIKVVRKKQFSQLIFCMVWITQKWKGESPSLIIIPKI